MVLSASAESAIHVWPALKDSLDRHTRSALRKRIHDERNFEACSLHQVNESTTRRRRMKTESVRRCTFLFACVLTSGGPAHLFGANMRSFIESVRRKAPVVYVGSVKEVSLLQRTKFDIKTKAVIDIKAVMRTPGTNPQQATIEYSSYDDKTPMLAGGPQYQLRSGVSVIVFANSFDASIPPGYLAQGSSRELLQRVEALRDALERMSADQLNLNEITEDDRRVQMSLYEKLFAHLRAAK